MTTHPHTRIRMSPVATHSWRTCMLLLLLTLAGSCCGTIVRAGGPLRRAPLKQATGASPVIAADTPLPPSSTPTPSPAPPTDDDADEMANDPAFAMGLGIEVTETPTCAKGYVHNGHICVKLSDEEAANLLHHSGPTMTEVAIESDVPAHDSPDAAAAHREPEPEPIAPAVDASLVHPLHLPDNDEPILDKHGLEVDNNDLARDESRQSPHHPQFEHPLIDGSDGTRPDAYQTKLLREHLNEHHAAELVDPPAPAPASPEKQPSSTMATIKDGSAAMIEHGKSLLRVHEYSLLQLIAIILALLVTVALCCVAFSLHCRCSDLLTHLRNCVTCCCPCSARLVHREWTGGREIALKKTPYGYDNSRMGDDDGL